MWPNIEKWKDWDLEVSRSKKWDNVVMRAEKELSEALVTQEEDYIEDLARGRITGDAFVEFLIYYGYQRWEKVKVSDFERDFEDFKMTHPTARHIIY